MLNKAIFYGKEHRKPYYGIKAVIYACCNHGSCVRCRDDRMFFDSKWRAKADLALKEFLLE